jgi:hypothetical protein
MLLLRIRQRHRLYLVNVPEGSRFVKTRYGYPALVIKGGRGLDGDAFVLAPRILDVAARGMHGLSLCDARPDHFRVLHSHEAPPMSA